MGLLSIPRALLAQRAGQLVEPHVVVADRASETRDVDARQVVGLDRAVELAPRRLDDTLVRRCPSACRIVTGSSPVGLLGGELDVGEHPVGVGVGDEHRSVLTTGGVGEIVAVDESHP